MRRSVFILIGSLMLAAPVGAQQRIDGEGFVWTIVAGPGIGQGIVQAGDARDYPVIQGLTMMLVFTMLGVNLLVDIIYAFVDPRISYSR